MTAHDAIKIIEADINSNRISDEYREALKKAVEALETYTHDGCEGCIHVLKHPEEEPCSICRHSYIDRYEGEKPEHKGRWIRHDNGLSTWYACDRCGGAGGRSDKYCRHCGAEMGVS